MTHVAMYPPFCRRMRGCVSTWHVSAALALAIGLLGRAASFAAQPTAEDFKVENSVYTADGQEPAIQTITYFKGEAVYDSIKAPAEVAIFEKSADRFVLLDVARRVRSQLSTKQIAAFSQRLKEVAARNADPLIKFSAEPAFQEHFDAAANELTFSSQWLNYRVVMETESNQEVVARYREFCDWDARLNTMLTPGMLPPFGRLQVNAAVAQRRALAAQVFLTITSPKAGQPPTKIRSEHHLVRPLTAGDLSEIARLRGWASEFKSVSFDEYRKAGRR
jgi:hypothetical protein